MDINKKLKNKIIKFADDTKLWGKADTSEDIEGIREDLLELSKWSKENLDTNWYFNSLKKKHLMQQEYRCPHPNYACMYYDIQTFAMRMEEKPVPF